MSQGPLPIEYSEVSRSGGATAEAGMLPYLDLIEAAGLRQSMRRRVGLREQGQSWTDDQLLTAGVLLNLAGGDSVDDLRVLEGDEGLGRMLRRAERHGLHRRRGEALARRWRRPRTRSVSSPTSLRRYLERFHDAQEEHKREPQRAFIPAPGAALRGLGRVNADLLAFAQRHDRQRQATLDMDATLVESSKRQAFYSYQHSRAYQPLTTYWAETDAVLHSEFRDGNVPAGFEQLRVLQEALEMLPSGVERVLMRSDTAGYQQELLRYCAEGRDARFGVIEFAVGAPVNAEFRRAVRRVPEGEWRTLPSRNEESPESDQQYAEVNYVPTWIGNHHLGPEYRFIATRERYRNPPLPGLLTDGELLAIFEQSDDVVENIYRLLKGNEGDAEMSEVRIIDDPTGNDREFITSIYKFCIVSDAGGCTVSPAYAGDQRGGVPATSADIYLNWEKIEEKTGAATTIAPDSTQFNDCIWPHGTRVGDFSKYAWELVVHEAGHALGMSGASVERSALDAVLDVAGISAISDIVAAIAGPDLDYATSHPTIASSALNYDGRVAGASGEPDCFPHPLDVLAVNALYQDRYIDPFFGPFEIETMISGTGQITKSPSRTTYPDGTEVTLRASWENATHIFEGWGGDCGHRATLTTCTVTMDDDKSVWATFSTRTALSLMINPVAGDDSVNEAEKAAGFAISGQTEPGAIVVVTVNDALVPAATAASDGSWTTAVPPNASWITHGVIQVSATASKSGFVDGTAANLVTVDLAAPSVTYTPPTTLTVGTAVTAIQPMTLDQDIDSYALKGSTFPAGLIFSKIPGMLGWVTGMPSATTLAETEVTIVVTDVAGNTSEVTLTFPVVGARPVTPPVIWFATAVYSYMTDPVRETWLGVAPTEDAAKAVAIEQVLEWALWEVPDYMEVDSGIDCLQQSHDGWWICLGFVIYRFSNSVAGVGSGATQVEAQSAAIAAALAKIPDDDNNNWTQTSLQSWSSARASTRDGDLPDLPDLPVRKPGRAPWWAR